MALRLNTDKLNEKKEQYRRNSLIAGAGCIAAGLVDILTRNKYVKSVAQLIEVGCLAAQYLFIGKVEGIEDVDRFTYDDGDD